MGVNQWHHQALKKVVWGAPTGKLRTEKQNHLERKLPHKEEQNKSTGLQQIIRLVAAQGWFKKLRIL